MKYDNARTLDCPPDWTELTTQCYRSFDAPSGVNAKEANLKCGTENATLVSVHSLEENQLITQSAMEAETVLNGRYVRHTAWVWLDQSRWDYSNWGDGEPGQGDCIFMGAVGTWRAANCWEKVNRYVCRLKTGKHRVFFVQMLHFSDPILSMS